MVADPPPVLDVRPAAGPDMSDLLHSLDEADDEQGRSRDLLRAFLRLSATAGRIGSAGAAQTVRYWVSRLDRVLSAQLNAVMHHPSFQALEGTWRGLLYLVGRVKPGDGLKVKVLNVTKPELVRDLERAVEFDTSVLFRKVYEEEYGQLGGEPYGLLVGDYRFGRGPVDVALLRQISQVAAAAHAPFVAAADPKMFNADRFAELAGQRDLGRVFAGEEYAHWQGLRDTEDARYVALALPRVLGRLPHGEYSPRVTEFLFTEAVGGPDPDKYLWVSAAWAYAAVAAEAFVRDGWFMRTRGVEGGGRVNGLPAAAFPTDDGDVAVKSPTEVALPERREFELADLGFLPLLHAKNRGYVAFMGGQSVHRPRAYADPAATANAELSAKFNYLLSVSRFAHYVKVLARDKLGSGMEAGPCEGWLNDWLQQYVIGNPATVSDEVKARKPLTEAEVRLQPVAGQPGRYQAVVFLRPHYQVETLTTAMRLVAEVPRRS